MPVTTRRPGSPVRLRLWPAVVIVAIQLLIRFVLPVVAPDAEMFGAPTSMIAVVGGLAGLVALLVWWLFFSRAAWSDRLIALAAMIAAIAGTRALAHASIQNGMMGLMLPMFAVPVTLGVAFLAWAIVSSRLAERLRRPAMIGAIVIGCGVWLLARTDGLGGGGAQLAWRWTPTAEDRLLAQAGDEPVPPGPTTPSAATTPVRAPESSAAASSQAPPGHAAAPAATAMPADVPVPAAVAPAPAPERLAAAWPGFRGAGRDGIVRGVRIATDWSTSPPLELWRRPIGPGWSSFAVSGDVVYTQEQRGEDELVSAYRLSSGGPVWRHRDRVRFWESNGGAGPRSTPTLDGGRVFAFGATGILNALDATSGRVVWSRNVAEDTGRPVPDWGFSSSPLVMDDVVIVAAAGTLAGYDAGTGTPRWTGPSYGGSYSSPHRATLDGVEQVVLLGGPGAIGVSPASGTVLWEHQWSPGAIVQPAITADGDLLINTLAPTGGMGIRRLGFTRSGDAWSVQERWTSPGLKPYYNDFVVHDGHAYGFDGAILSCIDLADGTRKWKGGRYGNGQLVLLADQGVLLVVSEEGELALVSATPERYVELARRPALDGKTWNHPVVVGDVLLVRNGQEMAAFRITPAER